MKKNSDLVEFYNASINSISDLYKLIQVSKSFFEIIAKSTNLSELERNVPSYMFKDKKNFISAFGNKIPISRPSRTASFLFANLF